MTTVVHIITKLELGGAQQNTLYTVANLDRKRFRPVLVCGPGGELYETAANIDGCEFHTARSLVRNIRPLKDIQALIELYFLLRKVTRDSGAGPVIVHTHSSKAGILGRIAAYMAGIEFIVHTIHGFGFNDRQTAFRRGLFILAEKLVSPVTDRFVAVAEDNIEKGVSERIFSRERACVIRSGIDTAYFAETGTGSADVRSSTGIPETAPVACMVSCLKPQKSPLDFVRVAYEVLKEVPEAHFIHAGDGELRKDMVREAARLGVGERLHMMGWRTDVREIIHASDVLVLTSLWEGLPKVVLQAMASGRPVVATTVDGTPEVVSDGENGYLCEPLDVGCMADRVVSLLKDSVLAHRMGEAGKAMVGEFDEGIMLKNIEKLYDTLLKVKR